MTTPPPDPLVVAACNGPWRVAPLATRLARAGSRLLVTSADRAVAAALVAAFAETPTPTDVAAFLARPSTAALWTTDDVAPGRAPGPLAHLDGLGALVTVLDVAPFELEHLARWHRPDADTGPPRTQHYRYLVRPTRAGGVRVLEVPKERLKEVQRRVLRRIVAPLPVHPAAHGTAAGRGVTTAIAHHTGADVVVSLDIERFFPAVTAARVTGWFVHQGVAPEPARLLGRLVTNTVPAAVRRSLPPLPGPDGPDRSWWRAAELAVRHLPQGAPTSPALADRICRTLDVRLTALAARRGVVHTRYVDDLTFSGPTGTDTAYLIRTVGSIVHDEGFRIGSAKTRVQRSSGRQVVLGAVVNAHPGLPRPERDALRATVHNCRVHGWRTQLRDEPAAGFRERLTGRVSWLAAPDPVRGRRLLAELALVDWS